MATHADLRVVAPLVIKYFQWLAGRPDGVDPKILLEMPLKSSQRKLLLERMDDVNFIFAVTSPLREEQKRTSDSRYVTQN